MTLTRPGGANIFVVLWTDDPCVCFLLSFFLRLRVEAADRGLLYFDYCCWGECAMHPVRRTALWYRLASPSGCVRLGRNLRLADILIYPHIIQLTVQAKDLQLRYWDTIDPGKR